MVPMPFALLANIEETLPFLPLNLNDFKPFFQSLVAPPIKASVKSQSIPDRFTVPEPYVVFVSLAPSKLTSY